MNKISLVILLASTTLSGAGTAQAAGQAPTQPDSQSQSPRLLSAFFGLDNALPARANALSAGASGQDGMPVMLSRTIDPETLQPEDFTVVTRSGAEHRPIFVTLRPAQDPGENRTVLMIGEFGNAGDDPPVRVQVSGDLLSDGTQGEPVNFRGAKVEVTPLQAGPSLVWAEIVAKEVWSQPSRGSSCPPGTQQVVRATWAGGVRLPNRQEAGDAERALYRVTVRQGDGSTEDVTPAALADLGDNDNNHLLCLDTTSPATAVAFPAGHLVDPNGDLNPETQIEVTRAAKN